MLKRFGKSFVKHEGGATAIMFGVFTTTLILGVGAAMDMSNMVSVKTKLQSFADIGVLAAAASGETDQAKLKTIAKDMIMAQTDEPLIVDLNFIQGERDSVAVSVRLKYEPMMMPMAEMDLSAMAEAPLSTGLKLNLALVLDTTRSMDGARISTLKEASADLLDKIDEAIIDSDNVQISLVPFADYVRIDPSLGSEPWINVQPDHEAVWMTIDEDASTNCTRSSSESAKLSCDVEVMEERREIVTWEGCMGSRRHDYHKVVEYGVREMQGPAGHTSCSDKYNIMSPLDSDLDAIKTKIDNLTALGKTYIPAGLIWGWRTLDDRLPFDEAKSSDDGESRDVMLLMTDGANTTHVSEYRPAKTFEGRYHWGDGSNAKIKTDANALTLELCSSIKASNIEIITVAFEVDDAETITLMENCASTPANFYNAADSAGLKDAFSEIGNGFTDIRISR